MKLIAEVNDIAVSVITEAASDGKKKTVLEGIFLQAGIQNRNGRVYRPDVMEREVNSYTLSHIQKNRAYGELNHPQGPTINLDRVSHMVTELKRDGNNWIGKATLLETPMGLIAKGILEGGGTLGTSSRGLGTLKKNNQGIMEVQDDFRLMVAGDIVSDPSAPDAFLKGVMEGSEWIFDIASQSWKLAEEIENIQKHIHDTPKSQFNEQTLVVWERFLQKISNN